MKLGIILPQTEIGTDPGAIRAWAQGVEDLGFDQVQLFEHVLGANPATYPAVVGRYTHESLFHEPFVLLGYLAAITRRVELVTGILILPQRQTVLVAKQAAEVDVLSGGRLRLGIGVGSNPVEFEGLGEDFHNRGRRVEEQVALMRALWTAPLVTFHGTYHTVTDAGINPLPVQRPIPVWMGGQDERVLKRIGRMADGWIPGGTTAEQTRPQLDVIAAAARAAGRDPASIIVTPRVMSAKEMGPAGWRAFAEGWAKTGAQYVVLTTMRCGFTKPEEHLRMAREFRDALAGVGAAR